MFFIGQGLIPAFFTRAFSRIQKLVGSADAAKDPIAANKEFRSELIRLGWLLTIFGCCNALCLLIRSGI